MWKNPALPAFGQLEGVRVIHASQSVAGPFAAQMLAEFGADVVWIENPKGPDLSRQTANYAIESERRNERNLSLNATTEKGRDAFLRLIADADVFLETSKGGQWDRLGLSDEVMWQTNPRLVICHITGFGLTGEPSYVARPSYDAIAQAFGGYTWANRTPGQAPYAVGPYAADYMSALMAASAICAALYRAVRTGKGEMIDLAQYEVMGKMKYDLTFALTEGKEKPPAGAASPFAAWGCFPCSDGGYLQCCLIGGGVIKKACAFLGVPYGDEGVPVGTAIAMVNTPGGKMYHEALLEYLARTPVDQAQSDMQTAGLAVQKVNNFQDLLDDPHVRVRGLIEEPETVTGRVIKHVGPVPRFTKAPSRSWAPGPKRGQHNEQILTELGFGEHDIAAMYEDGTIGKSDTMR